MLRRSNSTSHIPVFTKTESRPRSKSSVRSSIKDAAKTNVRAGSTEKLTVPSFKRSTSSTNLKKSTVVTPVLQGARSSAFKSHSNLVTPASSSRKKSPYKFGSGRCERTVNDKKWVAEEYLKIRIYLQHHPQCQDHIPDMLKPPTINTFVYVMNLLFKDIDPRIEINMANYKEEILTRLKTMHYPGNISSSLLKTANTMHAWPQVVSIIGWLIDLIRVINPNEASDVRSIRNQKDECVLKYLVDRYVTYNEGGDENAVDATFIKNMEHILGINSIEIDKKIEKLDKEVKDLSNMKEKQMQQMRAMENINSDIKKEIDMLEYETDTFYEETDMKHKEMDHMIAHLKERKIRLNEDIETIKQNITFLQYKIDNQPCTYEEKCKLQRHIDELKDIVDLKKESLETKKASNAAMETKLMEVTKELRKKINHLNNELTKLTVIKPELKVLQLNETDFISKEFGTEIKTVIENKKRFEDDINKEIESLRGLINKMKNDNDNMSDQIKYLKNEIHTIGEKEGFANKHVAEYKTKIAAILNEHEHSKMSMAEELKKLEQAEPDIQSLRQQLHELKNLEKNKQADLENVQKETLIFFEKLNEEFMDYLGKMNEIRTEIFDLFHKCINDINAQEEQILQDLETLFEFGVEDSLL